MKLTQLFHHKDLKKGIFYIVLAWLSFSTMWMLSKLIGKQTTVPTMIFFRNVFGILAVLPWIFLRWPKSIAVKNFKVVLGRALNGLISLALIFLAVQKISLINTTLIANSAPFFVPLILWFWMRIPINHKVWPAMIAGFIGMALVLQPGNKLFDAGAAYAILAAISIAFSIVLTRMATKSESPYTLIFYFFAIGAIASFPFAALDWAIASWITLIGLLGIGACSCFGQLFLYYGLKEGKSHQLAPFIYVSVIFSGLYEWMIWGDVPTAVAYIGMALIIGSGIWIFFVTRQRKEKT